MLPVVKSLRRLILFLFLFALFCAARGPAALAEEAAWSGDDSQLVDVTVDGGIRKALTPSPNSPSGNTVIVENTSPLQGYVLGGYSHTPDETPASVSDNKVFLGSGTDINRSAIGGYAASASGLATALGNTVHVTGATVGGDVYGGSAWSGRGASTASGNSVFLDGGSVSGWVSGGYARVNKGEGAATAERNTVSLKNVTLKRESSSGHAFSEYGVATASDNTFLIGEGTTSNSRVIGGYANSFNNKAVTGRNNVVMSGGTVQAILGGNAVTDNSPALAEQNSVVVSGGLITRTVTGGRTVKNQTKQETSNIELIARDNHVHVSGGTVEMNVYGSSSHHLINTKTSGGTAIATVSSVSISGGTIRGNIYGGYSECLHYDKATASYLPISTALATHNTVTLSGAPVFGSDTRLYGGDGLGDATSDFYTGNTLNVFKYFGKTRVAGIANFQNYNFLVPSTLASGSAYLQTGELDLGSSPRLGSVLVTADRALPDNYSVDLIRSDSAITGSGINRNIVIPQGVTLEYDGIVTTTEKALNLTLKNPRAAGGSKAISEGRAASLALTVQGAHFLASRGIAAVRAATEDTAGFATFGVMEGGSFRYNTGSHVDVKGVSLLVGVAAKVRIGDGLLVIGPAFEAAYADFDGYSARTGGGSIKGSGYGRSAGGALLGRYQHDSGAYLDASIRAGVSYLSYNSGLRDSSGRSADYTSEVPYYGLHVAPGWQWRMTEKATLDLSAAYLWTHMEGSTETLSTGDRVRFKEADSHRLRGGARFSYEAVQGVEPYVGASYEYELDGDARAGAYGHAFETPSLKGGTGVGEAGLYWKAGPLFIDAGVQGYTGVREGVGGSLMVRLEF